MDCSLDSIAARLPHLHKQCFFCSLFWSPPRRAKLLLTSAASLHGSIANWPAFGSLASSEGQFVRNQIEKIRGHLGQSLSLPREAAIENRRWVGSPAFEEPDALIA
jgi:hypothetical protein